MSPLITLKVTCWLDWTLQLSHKWSPAFQVPFLLSPSFWQRGPAQYCVCALSDMLAVGNEPSDGEWLPTRAECHYEWRLLRACHHHREFITTSDDDNGLCCKWLWMSSVFGKRCRVWLEFFFSLPQKPRRRLSVSQLDRGMPCGWGTDIMWMYCVCDGLDCWFIVVNGNQSNRHIYIYNQS